MKSSHYTLRVFVQKSKRAHLQTWLSWEVGKSWELSVKVCWSSVQKLEVFTIRTQKVSEEWMVLKKVTIKLRGSLSLSKESQQVYQSWEFFKRWANPSKMCSFRTKSWEVLRAQWKKCQKLRRMDYKNY